MVTRKSSWLGPVTVEMARGRGVILQRYAKGGLADVTTLTLAEGLPWRTGAGMHGRMTQEELAERLGVSVDAVGKYERSQSFIRGDLEHRLADALGWSREEILACREDWASRRRGRTV